MKRTNYFKLLILLTAVITVILIPGHVFAADNDVFSDSSKIEVVSQESWPIDDGVTEYKVELRYKKDFSYSYNGSTYNVNKGSKIIAYAVKIDKDSRTLLVPSIGGYYTEGSTKESRSKASSGWSSSWGGKLMTVPDQAEAYSNISDPDGEVIAAINSDTWSGIYGKPNGKLTIEGNVLSTSSTSAGAFAVTDEGIYKLGKSSIASSYSSAMGTWGSIVDSSKNSAQVSEKDLQARSAIGIKLDGSVCLITIPKTTNSVGIGLYDLADLLVASEFRTAHNLDGGRSATLMSRRQGEELSIKSDLMYAGGDTDDDPLNDVYRARPVSSSLLLVKTECIRGNDHHYVLDNDGETVICDRCGDEAPDGTIPEEKITHYENAAYNGTYGVSVEAASYRSGQKIRAYATAPFTDDTAWVAIYPKGATPRQNIYWEYVEDISKGLDITGGKELAAGEYAVSVIGNNGYKAQATVYVTIEKPGYVLDTDKDAYYSGEGINISTTKPDGYDCWVGIYMLGSDSQSITWYYIDKAGTDAKGNEYDITKNLSSPLPAGKYKVTLSTADDDNNSTAAAIKIITVSNEDEETSLQCNRIILPGQPVNVSASSKLDKAWVAIYKGKYDETFDYEYGGRKYLYYHYIDESGAESDVDITEGNYDELKEGDYTIVLFHSESGDEYVVDQYKNIKIGSLLEVSISDKSFTYNGSVQKPEVIATELDDRLAEGTDYEVTWQDDSSCDAGTYTLEVAMKGDYEPEGSFSFEYKIEPKSYDEDITLTQSGSVLYYSGKTERPDLTLTYGEMTLKDGTDYDISWSDPESVNVSKGYSAGITFKGNYTGETGITYRISAKDISSTAKVSLSQTSFAYNWKAQTPSVTAKDGDKILTEGTDYEVEYSDDMSTKAGTYYVSVNFIGNYRGDITVPYTIVSKQAGNLEIDADETYFMYDGTLQHPDIIIRDGDRRLVQDTDYDVSIPSSISPGNYSISITYKGQYTGSDSVSYTILRKTPTASQAANAKYSSSVAKVKGLKTTISSKNKSVKVKFNKVSGATNYRIAYRKTGTAAWKYKWTGGKTSYTLKSLKSAANYQIKVIAFKNDKGTWIKGKFSTISRVQISRPVYKLTSGSRSFNVNVTKLKGVTGYNVAYRLKGNTTWKSTKTTKTTLTIKKLKAKKTYQVKVRAYKKVSGKIYYGQWSAVKTVKTKK